MPDIKLPSYAIFLLKSKKDEFLVRKLMNENTVGISIHKDYEGWSPSVSVEYFLTKKNAIELIEALKKYFNI